MTWWALIMLMAGLTAASISRVAGDAAATAAAWGETTPVLVAYQVIEVGGGVATGARTQDLPTAMIPDDAVAKVSNATVAVTRIHPGEVILGPRISDSPGTVGEEGSAASMLPAGTGAVGLPRSDSWPQVMVGDRLDLLATFNPTADQPATTTQVASGAVVVSTEERTVTVAVPEADLPTTVHALRLASITVIRLARGETE